MDIRLSYNGALVLQALARGYAYGFEIMRAAHLPSGTVYPLLRDENLELVERELARIRQLRYDLPDPATSTEKDKVV